MSERMGWSSGACLVSMKTGEAQINSMPPKKRNHDHKTRLKKIRRRWLNIYKVRKGCSLCGYNENSAALQFDHLDPSTKVRDVSNMITLKLKRLMDEVRKCRVLCANCHMIHTFGEDR